MMDNPPLPSSAQVKNGRRTLILIVVIFLGTALIAGVLRFSGWQPTGSKNKGFMLNPPLDLTDITIIKSAGESYPWNPSERQWRLFIDAPEQCDLACNELAVNLDKVWRLLGHSADKVDILWMGGLPANTEQYTAFKPIQLNTTVREKLAALHLEHHNKNPEPLKSENNNQNKVSQSGVDSEMGNSKNNISQNNYSSTENTGLPVYIIDPNGFVILYYAPHSDPANIRSDLAKLLKLL